MVSTCALTVVAALNLLLGVSFFFEQDADQCSTAPTLASWLFSIGILDILWDLSIFSPYYACLPTVCRIVSEIIFSLLVSEVALLIVWCQIEKLCSRLTKSIIFVTGLHSYIHDQYEGYFLGAVTSTLSLAFVIYADKATGNIYFLQKSGECLAWKIGKSFASLAKYLRKKVPKNTKVKNKKIQRRQGNEDCKGCNRSCKV
uniref:Uncharacterized protein n=1 Tax=Glossina pallidipes TaxID=7398 RepID=A0A1B0A9J8_GLOPL